jgi:hypothetical protein
MTDTDQSTKMPELKHRPRSLPLCQLAEAGQYNGEHAYCNYCTGDAVWFHFADDRWNHEHFACDEHVILLNPRTAEALARSAAKNK